jgi:coenzyme F420-reducing hydrogenase beta subunit
MLSPVTRPEAARLGDQSWVEEDSMAKKHWGIAWDAFARAGYKCEYCGLDVAIKGRWYMYDHDHLVPRGAAGDSVQGPLNIAGACIMCNRYLKRNFDPNAGAGVPNNEEERKHYIKVVSTYVATRRKEREAQWGADVAAILAETGREYHPEEHWPD